MCGSQGGVVPRAGNDAAEWAMDAPKWSGFSPDWDRS